MRKWLLSLTMASVAFCSSVEAGVRSVSPVYITIDGWKLVPTFDDSRTESVVAIRDPSTAIGSNVTTIWFVRSSDATWTTVAWRTQNTLAALAHVKATYRLPNSSDSAWPVPGTQGGINPTGGVAPEAFGLGLFATDPLLPTVEAAADPTPILDALVQSGWSAARLSIQTRAYGCTQNDALSTIAAAFEIDKISGLGGALATSINYSAARCDEWQSVSWSLRADGSFEMPDLSPYLAWSGSIPAASAWQIPAAGSQLQGPQYLVVTAGGVSGGNQFSHVHLAVSIEDRTAPSLTTQSVPSETWRLTPDGVPYVRSPATVTITASSSDAVDQTVSVTALDNGQPYTLGTPISAVGVHVVAVTSTDDSGNSSTTTKIFDVREREYLGATMVVEDLDCQMVNGELRHVDATVLLASHAFDVWGAHLATTQLFLLNASNQVITPGIIIIGIDPCVPGPGGVIDICYVPEIIQATYQDGYWRLSYSVDIPAGVTTACPETLMIAGRSSSARVARAFDFTAFAEAIPAGDAVNELDKLGLVDLQIGARPLPGCGTPGTDPPIQCQWKYALLNFDPGFCADTDGDAQDCGLIMTAQQYSHTEIDDQVGKPSGYGWAIDEGCPGAASSSCSCAASGTLKLWLEPSPPCTECTMEVRAFPKFTASAKVNTPALAVAGGQITVSGGGVNVSASGAVAVGDNPPTTIIIGPEWSVPVTIGTSASTSRTFSPETAAVATTAACSVSVEIGSGGYIDVAADGWGFPLGDLYGYANGKLSAASPNVTITGTVTAGPCQGLTRTVNYK